MNNKTVDQYTAGWNYRVDAESTGEYRIKSRNPDFIAGYKECNYQIIKAINVAVLTGGPCVFPERKS